MSSDPKDTGSENNNVSVEQFNSLEKSLLELQRQVSELSDANAKKDALISELTNAKKEEGEAKPEKLELPTTIFKVNGKSYKFALKAFMLTKRKKMPEGLIPLTGTRITAKDALQSEAVLKELVRINSAAIVEVTAD